MNFAKKSDFVKITTPPPLMKKVPPTPLMKRVIDTLEGSAPVIPGAFGGKDYRNRDAWKVRCKQLYCSRKRKLPDRKFWKKFYF